MLKYYIFSFLILASSLNLSGQDYIATTQNILKAIKNKQDATPFVDQIAQANPKKLAAAINTDEKRLAFWINLYNGLIQYNLVQNPKLFNDRGDFFSNKRLTVAGVAVSFDNIEHGVLRRGTSKLSYGYFKNPFDGDWHEAYMVDKIDWRIHFALNCGAISCPPVRIYSAETVNNQLNESSKQYLNSQVRYNKAENKVYAPKLMDWFSGDFDGEDGAVEILKQWNYVPSTNVDLKFNNYDWTLAVGPKVFYKND